MTKTVSTASFTMLDQPLHVDYKPESGAIERVALIGTDVSRSAFTANVALIVRPDGSELVVTEGRLGTADAGAVQTGVYATWLNYAGHTVVEYVDHTITVDGVTAPVNSAPVWTESNGDVFAAWRGDGVAREVPLWAVLDSRGNTDSEACLLTCGSCKDVWPAERLDGETFTCPLCIAAEVAAA